MSAYWDEPVYADVEREALTTWLAERPAPDAPDYHEPTPADWPFRQTTTEPDPWNRQCDRCMEWFEEPGCAHGLVLCPSCALSGCQSCACEESDAAAIQQQQHDEWWDN